MNLSLAKKVEIGTLVRSAWMPGPDSKKGIILSKEHVVGQHRASILGQVKNERYDFWVQWLGDPAPPIKLQSWEVMLVEKKDS